MTVHATLHKQILRLSCDMRTHKRSGCSLANSQSAVTRPKFPQMSAFSRADPSSNNARCQPNSQLCSTSNLRAVTPLSPVTLSHQFSAVTDSPRSLTVPNSQLSSEIAENLFHLNSHDSILICWELDVQCVSRQVPELQFDYLKSTNKLMSPTSKLAGLLRPQRKPSCYPKIQLMPRNELAN